LGHDGALVHGLEQRARHAAPGPDLRRRVVCPGERVVQVIGRAFDLP